MLRHTKQPVPNIDKNLWVILKWGPEKFYVLPSQPTHAGRFTVFDTSKSESFRASFDDVAITSPEAKYWLKGYVVGSSPSNPTNFSGFELPQDHPLKLYFDKELQEYWEVGRGARISGYFYPNCFNLLLQFLLKPGQATTNEIAGWTRNLDEPETPQIPTLSDPVDLLKWIRTLENADSLQSKELIHQIQHPGDDVNASVAFELYVSFISCRATDLFNKDNLTEAVNFFFKDSFWKEEADEVSKLLSDFPAKNREILSKSKFLKISDPELAEAIFSGLGLNLKNKNPGNTIKPVR